MKKRGRRQQPRPNKKRRRNAAAATPAIAAPLRGRFSGNKAGAAAVGIRRFYATAFGGLLREDIEAVNRTGPRPLTSRTTLPFVEPARLAMLLDAVVERRGRA